MKAILIFALLFVASAFADGNVVDLTPDNFDTIIDGTKPALIEFYAPWCGHCKKLAPDWELLADAFAHAKKDVVIAKVDADAHKSLGNRFDVSGYPTLKFFPKGSKTPEPYEGGRALDDLVGFVSQKTGVKSNIKKPVTACVDLDDNNFDKIVLNTSVDALVEFYAPWCGHCKKLAPDWEILAKAYASEPTVVIAKIDADQYKSAGSRYGVTGFPTIKWFPKGDKSGVKYEGARDVDSFVTYINKNAKTYRDRTGALTAEAGRISSLDDIVRKFTNSEDKLGLIKQAEEFVTSYVGEAVADAKYYVKVLGAALKNKEFVANEIARLDRMLSGSNVSPSKRDEFQKKKNVLSVFTN